MPGSGTRGRQLAAREVDKVRRELAGYREFAALAEQIVAVNEARPAAAPAAGDPPGQQEAGGEKDDMHPGGPLAG